MRKVFNGAFIIVAFSLLWWIIGQQINSSNNLANNSLASADSSINLTVATTTENVSMPEIGSGGFLLARISQNGPKILADKNSDKQFLIASITKLMTAIVATEHLPQNTLITVSKDDLSHNSSSRLFREGETFASNELIRVMLVESNNDAAWALARSVGGNVFINLMNEKAQEIGMEDTHFSNPVGLDPSPVNDLGNVSTPKDLLLLSEYILKNHPEIFEITKEPTYIVHDSNGEINHVAANTDVFLHNAEFPFQIEGSKTGTTNMALSNLLLIFRDTQTNNLYMSVVLHSDDRFDSTLMLVNALKKAN